MWQMFEVSRDLAPEVTEQVHRQATLALDVGLPMEPRVAVYHRHSSRAERFLFSPTACELFKTLVQFHGGHACKVPRTLGTAIRFKSSKDVS